MASDLYAKPISDPLAGGGVLPVQVDLSNILPGVAGAALKNGLISEMPRTPTIGPQLPKLDIQGAMKLPDLASMTGITAAAVTGAVSIDNPLYVDGNTTGANVRGEERGPDLAGWQRAAVLAGGIAFGAVAVLGGLAMMTK